MCFKTSGTPKKILTTNFFFNPGSVRLNEIGHIRPNISYGMSAFGPVACDRTEDGDNKWLKYCDFILPLRSWALELSIVTFVPSGYCLVTPKYAGKVW